MTYGYNPAPSEDKASLSDFPLPHKILHSLRACNLIAERNLKRLCWVHEEELAIIFIYEYFKQRS